MLRGSEENNGVMDIETYLYRTDPYRSIDQRSPWPLPISDGPCDNATTERLKQSDQLREKIIAALTDHGIKDNKDFYVRACNKLMYPDGDNTRLVLRVLLDAPDKASTHKWSEARRALASLLSKYGFDNINVELVDLNRAFILSLFPISPDHIAVRAYENCRPALLRLLQDRLAREWTTLSLYRTTTTRAPSRPTAVSVVVMVHPYSKSDWSILKFQFNQILQRSGGEIGVAKGTRTEIEVEFIPGEHRFMPQAEDPTYDSIGSALNLVSRLTPYPKMGESLGFRDQTGGGTLGGFFKLRCGNQLHHGFLTNYDVVKESKEPDRFADQFGTSYADKAYATKVAFVAKTDAEATLEDIRKRKYEYEQALNRDRREKAERESIGRATALQDMQIEANEPLLRRYEKLEKICQAMPKALGRSSCPPARPSAPTRTCLIGRLLR